MAGSGFDDGMEPMVPVHDPVVHLLSPRGRFRCVISGAAGQGRGIAYTCMFITSLYAFTRRLRTCTPIWNARLASCVSIITSYNATPGLPA